MAARNRGEWRPAAALPVARVAVDVALAHLDRPFDYAVPEHLDTAADVGVRVRVRFAGRLVDGFVLERIAVSEHTGRLAWVEKVVSPEQALPPEIAALCRAVADRSGGVLADVLRLAVPPRHARVEKEAPGAAVLGPLATAGPFVAGPVVAGPDVTGPFVAGPDVATRDAAGRDVTARDRAATGADGPPPDRSVTSGGRTPDTAVVSDGEVPTRGTSAEAAPTGGASDGGASHDAAADGSGSEGLASGESVADEGTAHEPADGWSRYPRGRAFLRALRERRAAHAVWQALPGEEWAHRLAEAAHATARAGRGAVLVVPDQRDVDLVVAACTARMGSDAVVALTAELGPAERYRRWLAVRRGQVRIVVGTRSAAFAPVVEPGLLAIWDDGDDLHAEPRAPYPHVRDVLVLRAHAVGAALLVGGYARTAEGQLLVDSRWASEIVADRATVRAAMPRVHAQGESDLELARDPLARAARLPSAAFDAARAALAAGRPVLVQTPRAGYLPWLACAACRETARCRHCAGPLSVTDGSGQARDGALPGHGAARATPGVDRPGAAVVDPAGPARRVDGATHGGADDAAARTARGAVPGGGGGPAVRTSGGAAACSVDDAALGGRTVRGVVGEVGGRGAGGSMGGGTTRRLGGDVGGVAVDDRGAGPRDRPADPALGRPEGAGSATPPSCRWCGRVEGAYRCGACGSRRLRAGVIGSRRTAEELGRAFPGVPVRSSGGGAPVLATVSGRPEIVVATPGAEPRCATGYGAALLLDGWALLARPDLRVAEETVRRWMAAAAEVVPHGNGGQVLVMADPALPPVQALVRWDPAGHAAAELAARTEVGFPPAVRMAAVEGAPAVVADLLDELSTQLGGVEVLGPVELPPLADARAGQDETRERALVRVPRGDGRALATALHAAQAAQTARKAVDPVRVRMDPPEVG